MANCVWSWASENYHFWLWPECWHLCQLLLLMNWFVCFQSAGCCRPPFCLLYPISWDVDYSLSRKQPLSEFITLRLTYFDHPWGIWRLICFIKSRQGHSIGAGCVNAHPPCSLWGEKVETCLDHSWDLPALSFSLARRERTLNMSPKKFFSVNFMFFSTILPWFTDELHYNEASAIHSVIIKLLSPALMNDEYLHYPLVWTLSFNTICYLF